MTQAAEMKRDSNLKDDKKEVLTSSIKSGILEVSSDGTKKLNIYKLIGSESGRDKLRSIIGETSIVK